MFFWENLTSPINTYKNIICLGHNSLQNHKGKKIIFCKKKEKENEACLQNHHIHTQMIITVKQIIIISVVFIHHGSICFVLFIYCADVNKNCIAKI